MAYLLYRASTNATKPVATAAKIAPLTNLEVDGNFRSLSDAIDAVIPAQTGQDGKFLTTSGTAVSWVDGPLGYTGSSGYTGSTGYVGSFGATGYVGSKGYTGSFGYTGSAGPSTVLNATDDSATTTLYPVMVGATGSDQTPKASATKLTFNASSGTLGATVFNSLSDITQKDNIVVIQDSLHTVNSISGVEFTWKDTGQKSAGVIAQQIESVVPWLVATSDGGTKSVNYSGLIGYLVEAVKELSDRVAQLESKENTNGI